MSDKIETLRVDLGERSYGIAFGPDLLDRAAHWLLPVLMRPRVVVTTYETTSPRSL